MSSLLKQHQNINVDYQCFLCLHFKIRRSTAHVLSARNPPDDGARVVMLSVWTSKLLRSLLMFSLSRPLKHQNAKLYVLSAQISFKKRSCRVMFSAPQLQNYTLTSWISSQLNCLSTGDKNNHVFCPDFKSTRHSAHVLSSRMISKPAVLFFDVFSLFLSRSSKTSLPPHYAFSVSTSKVHAIQYISSPVWLQQNLIFSLLMFFRWLQAFKTPRPRTYAFSVSTSNDGILGVWSLQSDEIKNLPSLFRCSLSGYQSLKFQD